MDDEQHSENVATVDDSGHGHDDHGDHGGMHAGHEQLFRRRFFVSTLLSIPVVYFSEFVQNLTSR